MARTDSMSADPYKLLLDEMEGRTTPAPPAPRPAAPKDWRDLSQIAKGAGFTVTSTTGGRHNRGSVHGAGRAVDVRTRDKSPAEVERLMREAQSSGAVVRDERVRPKGQRVWTGPHLHLEAGGTPAPQPASVPTVADPYSALLDEMEGNVSPVSSPPVAATQEPVGAATVRPTNQGAAVGRPLAPSPPVSVPGFIDDEEPAPSVRTTPSLRTEKGRAARDVRRQAEREGGALYRIPVGKGATPEAVKTAAARLSKDTDVPPEFVEKWLAERSAGLYERGTNKPLESSPTGYVALPSEAVGQLRTDYRASQGLIQRGLSDAARAFRTHSPGEVLTGTAGAAGETALRAADLATRPIQAGSAAFWTSFKTGDDRQALQDAMTALQGEQLPESAKNPYGEAARNSEVLRGINPNLPAVAGFAGDLIDPTNMIPAGLVAKGVARLGKGAAEGSKLARVAEGFRDVGLYAPDVSEAHKAVGDPRVLGDLTRRADTTGAPLPDIPVSTPKAPRVIRHADPRIDGGEVIGKASDGRLKVKNNEGTVSLVKNPRTQGNRDAAIVRTKGDTNATEVRSDKGQPQESGQVGRSGEDFSRQDLQQPTPGRVEAGDEQITRGPEEVKERAFPKSAESAGLSSATDRTYSVVTDKAAHERAQKRIAEKGADKVEAELTRTTDVSKDDIVAGEMLARKYNAEGNTEAEVAVINDLAEKLTRAGQTVQAASLIARLSPEGVLLAGQRALNKSGIKRTLTEVEATGLKESAAKVREAEVTLATLEAEAKTTAPKVPRPKVETLTDRLSKLETEARARLAARQQALMAAGPKGSQAGASAIPLDIADYAIIGAAKIAKKGVNLADWTADMVREFGEEIRPHLKGIYRESYRTYDENRKSLLEASRERSAVRSQPGPYRPEDLKQRVRAIQEAQREAQRAHRQLATEFRNLSKGKGERVLEASTSFRRANLLSAVKTHLRNITSNVAFQGTEELSRPMAAVGDMIAKRAKGTGVRTTSGLSIPATVRATYAAAVKEGPRRAADIILGREVLPLEGYGKQLESTASKMQMGDSDTGIKILDAYVNTVFRTLTAEDAVFKVYAFRRELEDIARSQALSERAAGQKVNVSKRTKELQAEPTDAMLTEAAAYADYATFQNDNRVSTAIRTGKSALGPVGKFAIETIAPFDRTPTNIIYRVFENSPLGFISAANKFRKIGKRAAAEKIANAAFTRAEQKEFARTFGRASTGTILSALALILADKGLLSGTSSYEDDKADYFKKRAQVGGGGMLHVPGTNQRVSIIDSPVGKAMATVAAIHEAWKKPKATTDERAGKTLKSVANVALDQPLLKSTKELSESGSVAEASGKFAATYIPASSMLGAVGEVADKEARDFYFNKKDNKTFLETFSAQLKAKVPKVRESLPVNKDTNKQERGGVGRRLLRSIDPFNTTTEGEGPRGAKRRASR